MLRDYQADIKRCIFDIWEKDVKSVMVQMPTGTGKTVLMADLVGNVTGCVLIVAHRIELIEQIAETLNKHNIECGIIAGKKCRAVKASNRKVVVASIQTLYRNLEEIDLVPELVIIDEAHHALAKSYKILWEKWKTAKFLGLTATPCRMDKQGFTDLFDRLLTSWNIKDFIREGWLSDFDYVSVRPESEIIKRVLSLKKRGSDGDYQIAEMATVMDCEESIAHLFDSYDYFAHGKKGIVYAINRNHAKHIADFYSLNGVNCCVIDSKTSASERKRLVEEYRNGHIDVIVNVDIFSEGFDCPEVEFIQLARPTLSLAKYLQQVGRGMRISEGKSHVLILDQVGLYQTFGLPTEDFNWNGLFKGTSSGKGNPKSNNIIIMREETNHKTLVNLDMVRIKNHGEEHKGLEMFMQGGKYGVMIDGRITSKAMFDKIERIDDDFIVATFPYDVFRSRKTVIDKNGKDRNANLYGNVVVRGDFIEAYDINGNKVFWDMEGGKYYSSIPEIIKVGNIEMAVNGSKYQLRHTVSNMNFECDKNEIYICDKMMIFKNMLIVQHDIKNPYRIYGYVNGGILVDGRNALGYNYQLMRRNGKLGFGYSDIPTNTKPKPNMAEMKLKHLE